MMEWMLMPLRRYADFSGRSRRLEFWMFFLFQWLVLIALVVLTMLVLGIGIGGIAALSDNAMSSAAGVGLGVTVLVMIGIWLLFVFGTAIPNAALVVRRFHDLGNPGWVGGLLYALTFVLNLLGLWFINLPGLILLVFMCIDGNQGPNAFGHDPKGGQGVADTFA
jgi:uncharacterized membrane protein YhaH (DUF805 family)